MVNLAMFVLFSQTARIGLDQGSSQTVQLMWEHHYLILMFKSLESQLHMGHLIKCIVLLWQRGTLRVLSAFREPTCQCFKCYVSFHSFNYCSPLTLFLPSLSVTFASDVEGVNGPKNSKTKLSSQTILLNILFDSPLWNQGDSMYLSCWNLTSK